MKKKTIFWLIFFSIIFWTCTDESPFGSLFQQQSTNDTEMVKLAKEVLQKSKYELSLPDVHKDNPADVSTRSLDYSTRVTPLWERAQTYVNGENRTLLIPSKSEDEVRSRVIIRRGNEVSYQFAKASSFFVVQQIDGYTISRVMTYLPESSYAEEHTAALDTIGYNPSKISFHGLSIVSRIDGSFLHAFLYDHGKITNCFVRNQHLHCTHEHHHGEECEHEHTTDSCDHERINLYIELYTKDLLTRSAYTDGSENGTEQCEKCGNYMYECKCYEEINKNCIFCNKPVEECTCNGIEVENQKCKECGEYLQYCFCCGICGFYPCTCDKEFYCPTCKHEPCECTPCPTCKQTICICDAINKDDEEGEKEGGTGTENSSSVAPKAQDIFRNSSMTEENWKIVEGMIEKIMKDCMGNNLYNGLKAKLNGGTLIIQFNEGSGGSFFFGNGTSGISLGSQMESNQLVHEMMHAYASYQETESSFNNSVLNGEIEAFYTQYLYVSKLSEYKGSKWEERDVKDIKRKEIRKLVNYVDEKGNLLPSVTEENLKTFISGTVVKAYRSSRTYKDYSFDSSRSGLNLFNNLRTITANCE